ncbi:hypothetical protein NPIL_566051 [Nephila pilipes]|uniref:Uncharacterized protein n=1 Tax=Nephila pilipes TaxID=299642 RepID=A0A8X6R3S8_NEPPI|nr:hypothetical protein NPIL_566051 [Nephila pilipes]
MWPRLPCGYGRDPPVLLRQLPWFQALDWLKTHLWCFFLFINILQFLESSGASLCHHGSLHMVIRSENLQDIPEDKDHQLSTRDYVHDHLKTSASLVFSSYDKP